MQTLKFLRCYLLIVLFVTVEVRSQVIWTKNTQNPVLTAGVYNGVSPYGIDGAFDVGSALSPSVIFKNGL